MTIIFFNKLWNTTFTLNIKSKTINIISIGSSFYSPRSIFIAQISSPKKTLRYLSLCKVIQQWPSKYFTFFFAHFFYLTTQLQLIKRSFLFFSTSFFTILNFYLLLNEKKKKSICRVIIKLYEILKQCQNCQWKNWKK